MIENFNIKFLPVILLLFINFYSGKIKAVESKIKADYKNVEIQSKVETSEKLTKRKGFLKRLFKKVNEKVKETSRHISHRIKRIFSKRKAKKQRMKSGFRNKHKNLFNILVFLTIFLSVTGLLMFLYLSSLISTGLFIILMLAIGVSAIVISLIYFSERYIVKPNYRS